MNKFMLTASLFAMASVASITFGSASVADSQVFPKLNFEKYKLKNGLDVILLEDHRLPLVAVNLWYHVGPANERPGLTGFAHLFEHMMFQGSKHVADDAHFKILEGAGASDINGTTDFDRTNYFETLPSNQLELALWLESDRMGFLLDTLDGGKLENQRDVVRNERRQSVENPPYGLVEEAMYHQLFPKTHPYYADVIGSHEDIEAARLNDVREFFKLYYAPNNASLAIVGDINKEEARKLVEKYFGPIPAGAAVPKIEAITPPITSERRVIITDQIELPRIYMAWITDPIYKPGDAEADLLANILGGGKSSRLYKKLVYEKQIAQDVRASQYSLILGSIFSIQATARPGVKPEDLGKAIQDEINQLQQDGPTQAELERARNTIQFRMIEGLETLGGFGGVADLLNQYNHYLGDSGYLSKDLERYQNATIDSVKKIANEKLTNNSSVVVYGVRGEKVIDDPPKTAETGKSEPEAASIDVKDWRRNQPAAAAAHKLSLPVPKSFKLSNGLTVLLLEEHSLPVIAANLEFLCGSELNPVNEPGLASFTADMLDEGTEHRSALEIADTAAQLGSELYAGSSSDLSFISLHTLKKNLNGAFSLFSDVALHPAFSAQELERVKALRMTQILQQKDNANALASKAFYKAVYGTDHPYGYLEIGTADSVKSFTRDDLSKFWSAGYVPENAALIVVGDISEKELRELGEKEFAGWKGKASRPQLPGLNSQQGPRIVLVDKPGAPQTQIRIGQVGVSRSNPDYTAIEVMNTMLGGLFSSRINMNLREKNGYTYGAYSVFLYRRGPGPFFAGAGVRTNVTAPAIKEIFNEIQRMRDTQLTPSELALAKDSVSRSLPGYFETMPQATRAIGELFLYDLPIDYYTKLPSKIEAVTAAEVQSAAQKYLSPKSMIVVAVGDRSKIESDIRKLDLGPIQVLDLDMNPEK